MNKELSDTYNNFKAFILKTVSLEDVYYTVRVLLQLYIIMRVTSFLNDKFIVIVLLNLIILYAPLEEKIPHFLFKWCFGFRQLVDGLLGIIDCLIPKYEEKKIEQ